MKQDQNNKELAGRTALVTGASSGLGVDFARELAARGADLVIVARRADRLETVAEELRKRHGISVHVEVLDLAGAAAADDLKAKLDAAGVQVDILVNNAGFGLYGHFLEIDPDDEQRMLDLDIQALTRMTGLFAAPMVERGWGRILQLSSIGAYQPSPTYAAYAAAKSYVLMYSHAVNHELRGSGVTSTVLSPGVTRTEFLAVSGQSPTLYQRLVMMESKQVARTGIRGMLRGRREIVPGIINALTVFSTRITPRHWAAAITFKLMT